VRTFQATDQHSAGNIRRAGGRARAE
jgi:hypothetical protein